MKDGGKDATSVDKSQEESEEDEMLMQARVQLQKFNEKFQDESLDFKERQIDFNKSRITNDSTDVSYTYMPKGEIPK